jgi:hypothetical protein
MVRSLAGAKMAIKQPPGKRLVRAVQWTAAVALLALAMFLRVYPLPLESLDGDEIFTLRVVAAPPAEAWNMIRQDLVHPPLYYFLLKATLPADDAPEAVDVRGLSLASAAGVVMCLLGIGAIVPAFRLPSFLAALLLALNKVHIFYSQQARSYSFYCLLVLLLVVWSVHFSKSASRWWYRVSGVALMTVILFTHYVGALFCLACAVSITLGRPGAPAGRSGRFLPLLLFACALVLFSPWLIAEAEVYRAKGGLDENLHWHGIPGFFELKMTFADFLGIPGFRGATTVAALLLFALCTCAFLPRPSGDEAASGALKWTLAMTALAPPVLLWLTTRKPLELTVFAERHVLPSLAAALLLAGSGLQNLACRAGTVWKRRAIWAGGALLLCSMQVAALRGHWPGPERTPYAAVAADILAMGTNFPVYTTYSYGIGEPVKFYLRTANISVLPATVEGFESLPERLILLYRPIHPAESAIAERLRQSHAVRSEKYYFGNLSPRSGTCMLILEKPAEHGRPNPA